MCWVDSDTHRLRVHNENSVDVDYRWDVYETSIKGSGTAKKQKSQVINFSMLIVCRRRLQQEVSGRMKPVKVRVR